MSGRGSDHYATLGVARSASTAEIKAAYRKHAMREHPDRNPGDRAAEERFKSLSEAYAVLSDPDRREAYERFGDVPGVSAFSGATSPIENATEFFDTVLGDLFGWDRKRAAGEDLRYTLELTLEEAALGCEKTIHFARAEDCGGCAGSGAQGGVAALVVCTRCEGTGKLGGRGAGGAGAGAGRFGDKLAGMFSPRRECLACGGTGQVPRIKCGACLGSGLADKQREFVVRIPAGTIKDGAQRIPGQGAPGRRGGPAGDLHVLWRVLPHEFFRVEDGRLLLDVPLTIAEAALGVEVDVPTLEGLIRMKIPAGSQSGTMFRARGKGLPPVTDGQTRGDLVVRVSVETPVALDDAARNALAALAAALREPMNPRRVAHQKMVHERQSSAPAKDHGKP